MPVSHSPQPSPLLLCAPARLGPLLGTALPRRAKRGLASGGGRVAGWLLGAGVCSGLGKGAFFREREEALSGVSQGRSSWGGSGDLFSPLKRHQPTNQPTNRKGPGVRNKAFGGQPSAHEQPGLRLR